MDWDNVQLPLFDPVASRQHHLRRQRSDLRGQGRRAAAGCARDGRPDRAGIELLEQHQPDQRALLAEQHHRDRTGNPTPIGTCITQINGLPLHAIPYGVLDTSPAFSPPVEFNVRARYDLAFGRLQAVRDGSAPTISAAQRNAAGKLPERLLRRRPNPARVALPAAIPNTTLVRYTDAGLHDLRCGASASPRTIGPCRSRAATSPTRTPARLHIVRSVHRVDSAAASARADAACSDEVRRRDAARCRRRRPRGAAPAAAAAAASGRRAVPPPPPPPPPAPQEEVLQGVTFETNSAKLRPESASALDGVVTRIERLHGVHVDIRGYTDSVGKPEYNQKLSERRANAVKDYLEAHGVPSGVVSAQGFGEENPLASNATKEGRAENRRVTIRFDGSRARSDGFRRGRHGPPARLAVEFEGRTHPPFFLRIASMHSSTTAEITAASVSERLRALIRQHQFDEALEAGQALLEQTPDHRDALLCVAVAQRYLRRPEDALGTLAILEQHHPRFSRLHEERGRCFVDLKQAPQAIDGFPSGSEPQSCTAGQLAHARGPLPDDGAGRERGARRPAMWRRYAPAVRGRDRNGTIRWMAIWNRPSHWCAPSC